MFSEKTEKKKEENKQIREKGEGIKKKRESLEERLFVCRHLFLKLSQIKTVLISCWEGATLCDFDIHLISPLGVCDWSGFLECPLSPVFVSEHLLKRYISELSSTMKRFGSLASNLVQLRKFPVAKEKCELKCEPSDLPSHTWHLILEQKRRQLPTSNKSSLVLLWLGVIVIIILKGLNNK